MAADAGAATAAHGTADLAIDLEWLPEPGRTQAIHGRAAAYDDTGRCAYHLSPHGCTLLDGECGDGTGLIALVGSSTEPPSDRLTAGRDNPLADRTDAQTNGAPARPGTTAEVLKRSADQVTWCERCGYPALCRHLVAVGCNMSANKRVIATPPNLTRIMDVRLFHRMKLTEPSHVTVMSLSSKSSPSFDDDLKVLIDANGGPSTGGGGGGPVLNPKVSDDVQAPSPDTEEPSGSEATGSGSTGGGVSSSLGSQFYNGHDRRDLREACILHQHLRTRARQLAQMIEKLDKSATNHSSMQSTSTKSP